MDDVVDVPNQTGVGHEGSLTALSDRPFSFAEARMVEDREKGAPRQGEPRILKIHKWAKTGAGRNIKKMLVVRIRDGLLALFETRVYPMKVSVLKGEGLNILD